MIRQTLWLKVCLRPDLAMLKQPTRARDILTGTKQSSRLRLEHEGILFGSPTNITRVPKGILGYSSSPASALHNCGEANAATPHQVVAKRLPPSKYRSLRLITPTEFSTGLLLGSYPAVVVL